MKPENVAVVFADADTGKAYAAVLNESETRIIMAMLSGLQDGSIKAREVVPFELRSMPHIVTSGIGKYSGGLQQIAKPQPVGEVTACYACNQQVLKREVLAADGFCPLCDAEISDEDEPDDKALCYQCGEDTRQRLVGDEWHCKACHAVQCERVRCESCGKTCTRPDGAHYCHGGGDAQ